MTDIDGLRCSMRPSLADTIHKDIEAYSAGLQRYLKTAGMVFLNLGKETRSLAESFRRIMPPVLLEDKRILISDKDYTKKEDEK